MPPPSIAKRRLALRPLALPERWRPQVARQLLPVQWLEPGGLVELLVPLGLQEPRRALGKMALLRTLV